MSSIRTIVARAARCGALRLTLAIVAAALAAVPARAQGPSDNPWVAPERATHKANPVPATTDAVKKGQMLFHRDCEQCHGKAGHGDGPQSSSLNPKPADLASARVQTQADGAIFWKISEGRGVMPRATLGESEKWAVIDYIRTLAAK
ncbi:MAG: c-type cytochrome [Gemmatimonadales bacterium]